MDDATLASYDAAAMDRLILMLLLFLMIVMMMVIHFLLRKEGSINDGVSKELLVVIQRLLDTNLRLLDGGEEGRVVVSSSASSDQQLLMDTAAKKKAAVAAKKKRNKAAANNKGAKRMSWRGGGILSLIMMASAFGSITTFIPFSLIPQSDGSSVGNESPPTLPPTASTSLRRRDLQSRNNMASSTSPANSRSPLAAVLQAPLFSPRADVSNRRLKSVDESAISTCFNTPNWKDQDGDGCDWYERKEEQGCPKYGSLLDGGMGVANDNCCYCGGGSHTLPPTTSPTKSSSPTKSATPSTSPTTSSSPTKSANPTELCFDTPNWKDIDGRGCDVYDIYDEPGCPKYGSCCDGGMGVAKDNCCYCGGGSHTLPPTTSPTKSSSPTKSGSPTVSASPTESCMDTPNWKDIGGNGCDVYVYDVNLGSGCPDTDIFAGNMGPATEHCCYCGGGNLSCEDFRSKCQDYINFLGIDGDGGVAPLCKKAESCSCKAGNHVKIIDIGGDRNGTVGLYNECKCDFWLRLCEDTTRGGEACDYAAEYCCGDYIHVEDNVNVGFLYLNSPQCYCDFFKYAQNEFGYTLKSKKLIMNKEFSNPCRQVDGFWISSLSRELERSILEVIYNGTDGQNWKNNSGWMNNETDYCQWYGISCGVDGFVTSIDLRDNNLAGQFPVYTVNVSDSATLVKLKTLNLADNKLTGTIDYLPLYNLNALTHFDVSGNQLSGDMVALVAPSLRYADLSNNNFASMRRFEKYKGSFQTLRYCDASNNAIQEDAADLLENIPPNIEQLFASNNNINGTLPASLNNLPKLRQFNMASNALSGELPVFADSTLSLKELDISFQSNGFTGSIPEDLLKLQSLNTLNLADNKLTGNIPRAIGFMAMLEVFDLSNNLLDSSIPSDLGMLAGSLTRLDLSKNALSGVLPSQIGQLHGATILLKDNRFHNSSATAPLSLCLERKVKEFDLANDTTLCPPERNALSDFYDSAKGAEWTDRSNWTHEYASYCDWKGVTCDNDKKHVIELNLSNNGLSGRLSKRIGELEFIEVLDLSDNDIKGSIPAEIGLLKNLTYLRLSYNALTGTAPKELSELTTLQLLQLQSNRITKMPNMPRLDDSEHEQSTFVTDCGVPSAFDEALECENCTMCCNANDDCYPQKETQVSQMESAAIFFACFVAFCCIVFLSIYKQNRRKNRGITLTRLEEDDKYALSKIGKDSVYSYFVTGDVWVRVKVRARALTLTGWWWAAFVTFCIQIAILVVFVMASEANLQKETIDIQFTWKCPRDTQVCDDKNDLTEYGWVIFCVLMIVFLAKDMIGGCKLIYHSAKVRHTLSSRVRYFFGGMCLCSITLFALYVSIIYNKAIATSDTELIVNSVIVLFVMEMDEFIFAALEAANENWTAHTADEITIDEMKEQIASQKEELRKLHEMVQKISLRTSQNTRVIVSWNRMRLAQKIQQESQVQRRQIASQQEELRVLREAVEEIHESRAAAQQLQLCYDFT